MKNIQPNYLKILTLVLLPVISFCKTPSKSINQADSLFRLKHYTQSFEIYKAVLADRKYTPAMLLKMAYIQEGLGHTGQCIYFLNLYHLASHDDQAQEKISELAAKFKLEGYESADSPFFLFIQKNSITVTAAIATLLFLSFALVVYSKRKKKTAWASFTVLAGVSALLIFIINFSDPTKKVIVENNATYLMSGPSAGASVVSIIGEGNQLKVTGKKDIWLKVEWLDKELYIKENQVLHVRL